MATSSTVRLALLCACFAAFGMAQPTVYTLQNVTFTDGQVANGSFTYDPSTGLFTNVNIVTTTGAIPGQTYTRVSAQNGSFGAAYVTTNVADQTGLPGLILFFNPVLDTRPSQVTLIPPSVEGTCLAADCSGATIGRFIAAGTLVASPIDFVVGYFANLTNGDSLINITNTGANGAPLNGPNFGTPAGNVCVNVYAFSPDEQLVACCSCVITPNGLVSLSVVNDLISNTLTGVRPNSVVVKILASQVIGTTAQQAAGSTSTCTNSAALVGPVGAPAVDGIPRPTSGIVAFRTTIHAAPAASTFGTTETQFLRATLSAAELASITNRCTNIIGNGSTFGICRSCRQGGLGAVRQ
jgi:hypothetical protein